MDPVRDVAALRQMLAGLEAERLPGVACSFSLGAEGPGQGGTLAGITLAGITLSRGALHEVQAGQGADLPAATGFTLALALRAAPAAAARPILWVRQDLAEAELGRPEALGLAALGLDPARLVFVRASDAEEVLNVAGDAVRCSALGALLIEPWGDPKALDLTATRRLAMRAASSGVTSFLLRATSRALPTAVATRWRVAPVVSAASDTETVGNPAFTVTLLRHRGGEGARPVEGGTWNLEWDHEAHSFRELAPLPRSVVPVPAGRPAGADPQPAERTPLAARRAG